jgi:hypothetical protein
MTLISGSAVWAGAYDGIIDSPAAIAGTIMDARRPRRLMS